MSAPSDLQGITPTLTTRHLGLLRNLFSPSGFQELFQLGVVMIVCKLRVQMSTVPQTSRAGLGCGYSAQEGTMLGKGVRRSLEGQIASLLSEKS